MNKKIIALLMVATTISTMSARTCYDRYGNPYECGIGHRTVDAAEGTVEGAADVASAAMPWNWGRGGEERREERKERREERREEREERRDRRNRQ
jgi:hypothetical protein